MSNIVNYIEKGGKRKSNHIVFDDDWCGCEFYHLPDEFTVYILRELIKINRESKYSITYMLHGSHVLISQLIVALPFSKNVDVVYIIM